VRFTPKHPQNVRQAITRLRLDEGLSGPEIVRKLAAGEIEGVEPVEVPRATVYYIAAAERDRRQAKTDAELAKTPEGKLALAHRRAVEMVQREIRRLERNGRKGGVDPVRLQRVTNSLTNLIRAQPPMPSVDGPESSTPEPKRSLSLEERLERAAREQAATEARRAAETQPEKIQATDSWPQDWRERRHAAPATEPNPPPKSEPTLDELLADACRATACWSSQPSTRHAHLEAAGLTWADVDFGACVIHVAPRSLRRPGATCSARRPLRRSTPSR
jgi:hypothetical protein